MRLIIHLYISRCPLLTCRRRHMAKNPFISRGRLYVYTKHSQDKLTPLEWFRDLDRKFVYCQQYYQLRHQFIAKM